MPNYSYMIAKAVDLVARKLAGMDPENASRVTQALSDEARVISDELQRSGQNVNQEILAARLDGLVTRMKYEMRNQEPDPSPHEFPIFNVSHNPTAPYPNPINHLYDKRYREAYSTFIKQNPPPTSQPSPSRTASHGSLPDISPRGIAQKPDQSNPNGVAMRPGQPIQYHRQGSRVMPTIPERSRIDPSGHLQRSSTADDLRSNSVSRSTSGNDLDPSGDLNSGKIRVRVREQSGSGSSGVDFYDGDQQRSAGHRSILKPESTGQGQVGNGPIRRIYAAPGTEVGDDTMQQLFQVANRKHSDPSVGKKTGTERVIIIDRRGSNSHGGDQNSSGKDQYRTFEIRTDSPPTTPTNPISPPSMNNNPNMMMNPNYYAQPGNYFMHPAVAYPQPKVYGSVPIHGMYGSNQVFAPTPNTYYPHLYYHY